MTKIRSPKTKSVRISDIIEYDDGSFRTLCWCSKRDDDEEEKEEVVDYSSPRPLRRINSINFNRISFQEKWTSCLNNSSRKDETSPPNRPTRKISFPSRSTMNDNADNNNNSRNNNNMMISDIIFEYSSPIMPLQPPVRKLSTSIVQCPAA